MHRTGQANELVRWVNSTVLPGAGDPDVLIVGDLNAYAGEDPIAALEGAGYTNLVKAFHGKEAYSYVFDGQWGYLDYVLASGSLTSQVTGAADVHHNADEPSVLDYNTNFKTPAQVASLYAPDRFRTSDHDPVLTGLNPTVAGQQHNPLPRHSPTVRPQALHRRHWDSAHTRWLPALPWSMPARWLELPTTGAKAQSALSPPRELR